MMIGALAKSSGSRLEMKYAAGAEHNDARSHLAKLDFDARDFLLDEARVIDTAAGSADKPLRTALRHCVYSTAPKNAPPRVCGEPQIFWSPPGLAETVTRKCKTCLRPSDVLVSSTNSSGPVKLPVGR
jgi:hypothetical protein